MNVLREGEIITVKQAADLLHVSSATAYRLVQSRELRAFRLGTCWRTSVAACQELIDRQLLAANRND